MFHKNENLNGDISASVQQETSNFKFLMEMTGIAWRIIYDNLMKFKHQGNLSRKEGSRRRSKFNTNDRRRLSLLDKYGNTAKAIDLQMKMVERGNL